MFVECFDHLPNMQSFVSVGDTLIGYLMLLYNSESLG